MPAAVNPLDIISPPSEKNENGESPLTDVTKSTATRWKIDMEGLKDIDHWQTRPWEQPQAAAPAAPAGDAKPDDKPKDEPAKPKDEPAKPADSEKKTEAPEKKPEAPAEATAEKLSQLEVYQDSYPFEGTW